LVAVDAGDFTGDGRTDLLLQIRRSGGLNTMLARGRPGGTFRFAPTRPGVGPPPGAQIVDVNGDGRADFRWTVEGQRVYVALAVPPSP
jgi:hypothetical protein